jgi:biopolymer transport protein ExbD
MATSLNETDGDHGFQIAPMVDIVFVLVLFFMACAGMQQVEKHLPGSLVSVPGPAIRVPLVVNIDRDGAVEVNGQLLDLGNSETLPLLEARLKTIARNEIDETPVVIRPNSDTPHARFVQVLSLMHKLGFKGIRFG